MSQPTSFFSAPSNSLDPALFQGERLHDPVRMEVLGLLVKFLHDKGLQAVEAWLEAWLAGSGVSYQWEAAREPGDLDCLIGVHYVTFRETNPNYQGLSDFEVASMLNDTLWTDLVPHTSDWQSPATGKTFELTYYCNSDSTDIRNLTPYAAYDLRHNEWTVHPTQISVAPVPEWDMQADIDNRRAQEIVARYNKHIAQVTNAPNPAARANAEVYLRAALDQAKDLYDKIHHGRESSFARGGPGYTGQGNYLWQAGKARGTVPAMKELAQYRDALVEQKELTTYGMALPDAQTLILRSMLWSQ